MKYGGGDLAFLSSLSSLSTLPSSRIARASSRSSVASAAGFGAPPPDVGSTRTIAAGDAGRPGTAVADGACGAPIGFSHADAATSTRSARSAATTTGDRTESSKVVLAYSTHAGLAERPQGGVN